MIFWIILIVFVLVLIVWCYTRKNNVSDDYPTMHAKCDINSPCNGELVCDSKCLRCKKKIFSDCANDVDCESGLRCVNWKCSYEDNFSYSDKSTKSKLKRKTVKWNDSKNKTRFIESWEEKE